MELKTITLRDLVTSIEFGELHLAHTDEEIELITIVELNGNTLTEVGKEAWKDVLDAKVTTIHGHRDGITLNCENVKPSRLKDFALMLAGYCSESKYNKWVNQ